MTFAVSLIFKVALGTGGWFGGLNIIKVALWRTLSETYGKLA
jgi:hypothetical protein